jgi:cytochrome c553
MPIQPSPASALRRSLGAVLLLTAVPVANLAADEGPTGAQIYRKKCASCHGNSGEGTPDRYPRPLAGNRSVPQLAQLIAKTMPDDAPGTCVGADADKVAAYIHDAFYSQAARERNQPPRIELSRLTVRQHQNAVADLVASFRTAGRWDEQRGLRGEYFATRQMRGGQSVINRLDAEIRFDFKDSSPDPAKIKPEEFSVRWQGSVLAPETGDYDFVLRVENGARLWVNDTVRPLIDAGVRSGAGVTERRGTIRLLGGRAYPIRLEFFKSAQAKEKTASVALLWKPPGGVDGLIPPRFLSPNRYPETLVLQTAFPPDDRSLGWERATTVSKAWDQAATDAAVETAGYVAGHLADLSGVSDSAADRDVKLRSFCGRFAERAFRRPLSDEEKRLFVDRQFEAAPNADTAVKRVVLLVLLSPRFLYREVSGGPTGYEVAARLSFALWDAPPDQELLDAAAAGRLTTREQVSQQAERMLADPRARTKVRDFLMQWLKLDPAPDLMKEKGRYPGFDAALVADLRTSLDLFLEDLWTGDADFRRLLLADELYLNGRLARFYGVNLPFDVPFRKMKLEPEHRAGVLTHPYVLANFAYTGSSSPIHRGVFLARGVLGTSLRPPPEAFAPLAENLHPKLTTRERVILQTSPANCQSCHGVINPLGFTLEHFDAVGRFRRTENGKPIDATGVYQARTGDVIKFTGARELARYLADSEEVQTAFVEHLFQHLTKQPVRAYGARRSADLRRSFVADDYSIRSLVVEAATVHALTGRDGKSLEGRSPPPAGRWWRRA